MTQAITVKSLHQQNLAFVGTAGVSQCNRRRGFVPGFKDRATGAIYISRKADGTPAAVHLFDGLPDELIVTRTASGQVAAVKGTVVAGFVMDGYFYTREQAALVLDSAYDL